MPLVLDSISRRFGEQLALDRVSLTIEDGDCYGLIGHNGAGKTSLLRIALGLARSDGEGRVLVDGFDAASHPREARARMGGLIEVPGFYDHLGGYDNLVLLARLQGMGRAKAHREAAEWLGRLGLVNAAKKPVSAYSQGMRQRLGIAQALLGRPKYLLLDEPTNGLDPEGIAELRELISGLVEEGITVLISSHQLNEIEGLCNRIAVIRSGRLVVEAATDSLTGGSGHYELRTTPRLTPEALAGLGFTGELDGDTWRVDLGVRAPGELARAVVEHGDQLELLAPHEVTLEEIYMRFARGDEVGETESRPVPEVISEPKHSLAPSAPVWIVLRHDVTRWLRRPWLPLLFSLPPIVAALSVWREFVDRGGEAAAVLGASAGTGQRITAFEGLAVALRAGLPWLAVLLACFASQSIAAELRRGTLRNLFLRPLGRLQVAGGKALASLSVGVAAYLMLMGASFAAAAWAFDFEDFGDMLPNGQFFPVITAAEIYPEMWRALYAPLAALAAYVGIGYLASSVVGGAAGALGLAIGLVLALDFSRGFARVFEIEGWLPPAHLPSLLGDNSFLLYYLDVTTGVGNARFEHASTAHWVPLLWCVLTFVCGALVLRRRSIS